MLFLKIYGKREKINTFPGFFRDSSSNKNNSVSIPYNCCTISLLGYLSNFYYKWSSCNFSFIFVNYV